MKRRPAESTVDGGVEVTTHPEPWLADWLAVRPDIDRSAIAINGRIIRLNASFEVYRSAALASLGLTPEVSDLIISLLRIGPPHELKAGMLAEQATYPLSTSGSMTYRIDRAEKLGLVERHRDPNDRRGVMVRLTSRGLDIANRDVDVHITLMREAVSRFSPEDQTKLAELMQTLLEQFNRLTNARLHERFTEGDSPGPDLRLRNPARSG